MESLIERLLSQIPVLLKSNQKAGALCNFYWVLHMAERGFLESANIALLAQTRNHILPLCTLQEQISMCQRLYHVAEKHQLNTEQIQIDLQLGKLKQSKATHQQPILFSAPTPEDYISHIDALNHFTNARLKLSNLSNLEKGTLLNEYQQNQKEITLLETQCQYDLISPVFIEQLKTYRNESSEKITDILRKIFQFVKILQTQGFYVQAQTLHYQTLETLSTQQSFYENTCLSDVDERFLLESLWALQENCLSRSIAQLEEKTRYFWSENLDFLQKLRAEKKETVNKLMFVIDELRYTPNYIESVESLQVDITESMKSFFARLFTQAESLLGNPPCDYCLMALGSFARGDMTPFSDLESVLLIEKSCSKGSLETLYFETLWRLVEFQIKALGESYDNNPGLHLDKGCDPVLSELIKTPEELMSAYGLKAITTNEESEGTLALTLLNSTVVYANEKKDSLWGKYHRLLNDLLTTESLTRQQKAQEQLNAIIEIFKTKTIPDFQNNCSVKNDFLAHLAYLLANLAFYHHLDTGNHAEILKKLVELKILDPDYAEHCRGAIAELNLWRLYLHLHHNQAQDTFPKDLPPHQQDRLKHIWQGLIYPLYASTSYLIHTGQTYHPIEDNLSARSAGAHIHYLLYTQSPNNASNIFKKMYHTLPLNERPHFFEQLEEIKTWGLDASYRTHTLDILAAQPNPDGWRPRIDQEKRAWIHTMLTLFDELHPSNLERAIENQEIIVYMPSFHRGIGIRAYQFKPDIYKQLYDSKKCYRQKPKNLPGRHNVLAVNYHGKKFWFKFFPEQPGTEFSINHLERLLGGCGTPMVQLIRVYHKKTKQSLGESIAVQLSEDVSQTHGVRNSTLEEALRNDSIKISKIDIHSFTQTLLRVLLTNPEDDKGDDYFLVPIEGKDTYRLVRIDNERAYYQPYTIEKSSKGLFIKTEVETKVLQVKSILYCLDQMQAPLDTDILEAFMRLETDALLKCWLTDLQDEHNYYKSWFDEDDIIRHFEQTSPGPSILGIPMADGLIKELLTRLDSMQQVIRFKMKDTNVKGMDLLKVVQPTLADYYDTVFMRYKSKSSYNTKHILQRFNELTSHLYKYNAQGNRESRCSNIRAISISLRLKIDLTEEDILRIVQGNTMSPTQGLEALSRIKTAQLETILNGLMRANEEAKLKFKTLAVRQQLQIINIITKKYKLNNSACLFLLDTIKEIPFHELSLTYFRNILTDLSLIPLLVQGAHKYLIRIDLTGCLYITKDSLTKIATTCPHLEELIIQNNNMTEIKDLLFPSLRYLDVRQSKKLKKLIIKAFGLKKLNAEQCVRLDYIATGSPMPMEANLAGCISITEQGIKNLMLLKIPKDTIKTLKASNINVQGCKQLPYLNFRICHPAFAIATLSLFNKVEINKLTALFEFLPTEIYDDFVEGILRICLIRIKYESKFRELIADLKGSSKHMHIESRENFKERLQEISKNNSSDIGRSDFDEQKYLEALQTNDYWEKEKAIYVLGEYGYPSETVVTALLSASWDCNMAIRQITEEGGCSRDKKEITHFAENTYTIKGCLKSLNSKYTDIRKKAVLTIKRQRYHDPEILFSLCQLSTYDPKLKIRELSINTLKTLDHLNEGTIATLMRLLEDHNIKIASLAAETLSDMEMRSSKILEILLLSFLKIKTHRLDNDIHLINFIRHHTNSYSDEVASILETMIWSQDSVAVICAAYTLTAMNYHRNKGIIIIKNALEHEDVYLKAIAVSLLDRLNYLGKRDLKKKVIDLMETLHEEKIESNIMIPCLKIFGELNCKSLLVLNMLCDAMGSENDDISQAAYKAVSTIAMNNLKVISELCDILIKKQYSKQNIAYNTGYIGLLVGVLLTELAVALIGISMFLYATSFVMLAICTPIFFIIGSKIISSNVTFLGAFITLTLGLFFGFLLLGIFAPINENMPIIFSAINDAIFDKIPKPKYIIDIREHPNEKVRIAILKIFSELPCPTKKIKKTFEIKMKYSKYSSAEYMRYSRVEYDETKNSLSLTNSNLKNNAKKPQTNTIPRNEDESECSQSLKGWGNNKLSCNPEELLNNIKDKDPFVSMPALILLENFLAKNDKINLKEKFIKTLLTDQLNQDGYIRKLIVKNILLTYARQDYNIIRELYEKIKSQCNSSSIDTIVYVLLNADEPPKKIFKLFLLELDTTYPNQHFTNAVEKLFDADPRLVSVLCDTFKETHVDNRERIASLFSGLKKIPDPIKTACKEEREYRIRIRKAVTIALCQLKCRDQIVITTLQKWLLDDKDFEVRAAAAKALGKLHLRNNEVVQTLKSATNDSFAHVQINCIYALRYLHQCDKHTITMLLNICLNIKKADNVRIAAIDALSDMISDKKITSEIWQELIIEIFQYHFKFNSPITKPLAKLQGRLLHKRTDMFNKLYANPKEPDLATLLIWQEFLSIESLISKLLYRLEAETIETHADTQSRQFTQEYAQHGLLGQRSKQPIAFIRTRQTNCIMPPPILHCRNKQSQ